MRHLDGITYNELMKARSIVENVNEYAKWCKEIPYICFKNSWIVKVIPPYAGAICRFLVKEVGYDDFSISVYLDCYDDLGAFGSPYWEIYPHENDVCRIAMNNVDELIMRIEESFRGNNI